jgi:hypothetical protein
VNSVFVYLPHALGVDQVAAILRADGVSVLHVTADGRGLAETGERADHAWFFVETDPAEVPDAFRARMHGSSDATVLVVEYTSIDAAKAIASALAKEPGAIVDTDRGDTLAGIDFLERLESDPAWDWRLRA